MMKYSVVCCILGLLFLTDGCWSEDFLSRLKDKMEMFTQKRSSSQGSLKDYLQNKTNEQLKGLIETMVLKTRLSLEKAQRQSLKSSLETAIRQLNVLKGALYKTQKKGCLCTPVNRNNSKYTSPAETERRYSTVEENATRGVKEENMTRTVRLINKIVSQSTEDNMVPMLMDVIVLHQQQTDVVVVSDLENVCVKSFWEDPQEMGKFKSSRLNFDVSGIVGKMAKFNENQIAVTVGNSVLSDIYIINVNPELSVDHVINHQRNFVWSICAVSSRTNTSNQQTTMLGHSEGLELVDKKGNLTEALDIPNHCEMPPFHLAQLPNGNIVISNGESGLVCVSLKGQVVWRYDIRRPVGITCDDDGNVYVANIENNKVIQLSSDGEFVKEVLTQADEAERPAGLYYDSAKEKLYVAEISGSIKIFQM